MNWDQPEADPLADLAGVADEERRRARLPRAPFAPTLPPHIEHALKKWRTDTAGEQR